MSAYGTIPPPKGASNEPLSQLLYQLPDKSRILLVVPFRRENVPDELADHLHNVRAHLEIRIPGYCADNMTVHCICGLAAF